MAMDIAMRSLRTYSLAMNVTDHNVANMNDPYYSRQLANVTAAAPLGAFYGVGQVGTGSYVSAIERIRNSFLDGRIMQEMSNVGKYEVLNQSINILGVLMPEITGSTDGLQAKIDKFFDDWKTLSTAAASGIQADIDAARAALYSNSTALAKNFNNMSAGMKNLQLGLTDDLRSVIDIINNYSLQIHAYNKEVKFALGMGQRPNDILDKRNEALTKLSQYVNVETIERQDGTLVVHINGRALVNGADGYNKLTNIPGRADTKLEDVAMIENGKLTDITKLITSGKLGGILEARDKVIKPYKDQLDYLASSLISTVNRIHRAGGTEETDFFLGFKADTIMVNPALEDPAKINYSLFKNNDLAEIIANLGNKVINNYIATSASSSTAFSPSQTIRSIMGMAPMDPDENGTLLINSVPVQYNTADTLETLVNKINNNVSNFSIVYNPHSSEFFMVANDLMTVQEQSTTSQSLLAALGWFQETASASPINSSPSPTIGKVNAFQPWNQNAAGYVTKYLLNTAADTGIYTNGQVTVNFDNNQYTVNWNMGMSPIATANMISTTGVVTAFFNPANQKFVVTSGVNTSPATAGIRAEILPFTVSDRQGNMTQVMNLPGTTRFGSLYEAMVGKVTGQIASSESLLNGYKAALAQYQDMQTRIAGVNAEQELANAKMYQRAYDASVKLMYIVDEMLNILINRTGTPSSRWE